jgi:hypothetical protein
MNNKKKVSKGPSDWERNRINAGMEGVKSWKRHDLNYDIKTLTFYNWTSQTLSFEGPLAGPRNF